jgi:hypothetical protein
MRSAWIVGALALLASCATPPAPPEVQAAHFGPLAEPPTNEQLAQAEVIGGLSWRSRPKPDDYVMVYPRDAWEHEVEATVPMDCLIEDDGHINCAAGDDGLPQYNFEQAARYLTTQYQVELENLHGISVAGRRLKIRVAFRLAG